MAHSMLNLRKIVVLMIIVQQLIANRHSEQCYILVNCVYCNEMQPLYIILKKFQFSVHMDQDLYS